MKTQQNNEAPMPEIVEFLKTTRTLINQLTILKRIKIPESVRQTIKTAVEKLFDAVQDYKDGDNS